MASTVIYFSLLLCEIAKLSLSLKALTVIIESVAKILTLVETPKVSFDAPFITFKLIFFSEDIDKLFNLTFATILTKGPSITEFKLYFFWKPSKLTTICLPLTL